MIQFATKFFPNPENFENAYRAGYEFAELALDSNRLMSKQTLSKIGRSYEFDYAMHFPVETNLRQEIVSNVISLMSELNSSVLVIHPEAYQKYREELKPIIEKVCIENREYELSQLEHWAESFQNLTLDIEKVWLHGMPESNAAEFFGFIESFIGQWAHKIKHVHLSGFVPGFDPKRPMYCSKELAFVVLNSLRDAGFAGKVVATASPELQTLQSLRMDRLLFDQWFNETVGKNPHGIVQLPTGAMPALATFNNA